jgi:hypothetical protein
MVKSIDIIWQIQGSEIKITTANFRLFLHPEDSVKKLVAAIRRRGGKAHCDRFQFILDEEMSLDKFRAAIKAAKIDWDFIKEYYTWAQRLPDERRYRLNHIDELQATIAKGEVAQ